MVFTYIAIVTYIINCIDCFNYIINYNINCFNYAIDPSINNFDISMVFPFSYFINNNQQTILKIIK